MSFALAALFWEIEPLLVASPPLFALAKYLALHQPDSRRIQSRSRFSAGWWARFSRDCVADYGQLSPRHHFRGSLRALLWFSDDFCRRLAGAEREFLRRILDCVHRLVPGERRGKPVAAGSFEKIAGRTPGDRRDAARLSSCFRRITLQELVDKYILPARARYVIVNGEPGTAGMMTPTEIHEAPSPHGRPRRLPRLWFRFRNWIPRARTRCCGRRSRRWDADGVNQFPVVDGEALSECSRGKTLCTILRVLREFAA